MVFIPVLRYSILLYCFLFSVLLFSQNLVKNPSFEKFVNCPKRLGNFDADVVSWSTPTNGSTDYFNACSTLMGAPENFNGEQPAEFGEGYAGLYLYAPDDYREYLQAELKSTLRSGIEYQVSFFVSLAERSDFAIKEFGVLFAKDKLEVEISKELSKSHWYRQKGNKYTYMEIGYTNFYADTQDWISVTTRFVAKGGEHYLVIGNFKNNTRTRKFKTVHNAKKGSYYYVDQVEVKVFGETSQPSEENIKTTTYRKKGSFTLDKTHRFENVLFDFDQYDVLDTAADEMQDILTYLKANAKLNITINGHTDTIGAVAYNNELSGLRAKAVAQYLIRMGLSEKRISWKGYGGQKPLASNDSQIGRRQNRRVEFVISRGVGQ